MCPELEILETEEAVDPVLDDLTVDLERLGDLLGESPSLVRAPLGATPPWRKGSGARDLPVPHTAGSQMIGAIATPLDPGVSMTDSTYQRTSCERCK